MAPIQNKLWIHGGFTLLMATAFGCQIAKSDIVKRSPDASYWRGETLDQDASGNDAMKLDGPGNDLAPSEAPDVFIDTHAPVDSIEDRSIAIGKSDSASPSLLDSSLSEIDEGNTALPRDSCGKPGFVFCEDFENGDASWLSTGGNWEINDGYGIPENNHVYRPTSTAGSIAYLESVSWQDMTVETKFMITSFGQSSSLNRIMLYARYQDMGHFYAVSLHSDGKLTLRRNANPFGTPSDISIPTMEWHTLKLRVSGPVENVVVEAYLDGILQITAMDTNGSLPSTIGTAGLGFYGGISADFDDFVISSP
jgi:hypothetical protein